MEEVAQEVPLGKVGVAGAVMKVVGQLATVAVMAAADRRAQAVAKTAEERAERMAVVVVE